MFFNSVMLAGLTGISVSMVFSKLPHGVKKFILKHAVLVDAVMMIAAVNVFGVTATGIMAGVMLDTVITMLIHIANHPEKFQYLIDFKEFIIEKLETINQYLTDLGAQYNQSNQPELKAIA